MELVTRPEIGVVVESLATPRSRFNEAGRATMTTIPLSRRQTKEASRLGGIELMIPWPEALADPPHSDRSATPHEAAWTRGALARALESASLRLLRVEAVVLPPLGRQEWEPKPYLAAWLVGERWADATLRAEQNNPPIMWSGAR